MTEPTTSHSAPRGIMVARVMTPLWGDGWVPLKILNTSDIPVTLRRNAKLAYVYTCLALEDMEVPEVKCSHQATSVEPTGGSAQTGVAETVRERIERLGLGDLDLESSDVSEDWQRKLADLVLIWTVEKPQGLCTEFGSWMEGRFACPIDACHLLNTTSSARS